MTTAADPSPTPAWLLQREVGLCPCGCVGTRRRGNYVEKTLAGTSRVVHNAMFSDDVAARPGLLQRIDARVKIVTVFGLLVAGALVHHIAPLLGLYAATLGLAEASRVALGFFVKRVWLFVPIFTGIVVAPAMFNVVTHGHVAVPLGTWFGHRIGLTRQGIEAAGLMISRVAVSISLVVLLTLTTAWPRLLAALRALFVPRVFVLVIGMAYRYLFHLLASVDDMYTARKARTAGRERAASDRVFVAASAGALFGRCHALSEEVHDAMLARGFTGEMHTLHAARVRARDALWSVACVATAIALVGVDRVAGR